MSTDVAQANIYMEGIQRILGKTNGTKENSEITADLN